MTWVGLMLRRNWFYPVAGIAFIGLWLLSKTSALPLTGDDARGFEMALLLDSFLTLPLLFWLCFRQALPTRALILGIVATMCSALWFATWIVPAENHSILTHVGWIRYLGLAVIALFEIGILAAVLRTIWKPGTGASDLAALGVPPFVAKLMVAEARFWRWVYSKFRK